MRLCVYISKTPTANHRRPLPFWNGHRGSWHPNGPKMISKRASGCLRNSPRGIGSNYQSFWSLLGRWGCHFGLILGSSGVAFRAL